MTTSGPTSSAVPAIDWMTYGPAWTMNLSSSWSIRMHASQRQVQTSCALARSRAELVVAGLDAGEQRIAARQSASLGAYANTASPSSFDRVNGGTSRPTIASSRLDTRP